MARLLAAAPAVLTTDLLLIALAAAFLLVTALALRSSWRQRAFVRQVGLPDDQKRLPLIGDVLHSLLEGGVSGTAQRNYNHHLRFGPVFVGFTFETPAVYVANAAEMKLVLSSSFMTFDRSRMEQETFEELLGNGLILMSNGPRWKKFRERAVQSLNHHGLQRAAATVRRNLEHMLTTLDAAAKGGKVIDMQTVLQQYCVHLCRLTFSVIADFAVGADLLQETCIPPFSTYGELWAFILHETTIRFLMPIRYWRYIKTPTARLYDKSLAELMRLANAAIDRRLAVHRAARDAGTEVPRAERMIDSLTDMRVEDPKAVTRFDILQQAITFLFAGHDTTTNMILWALYEARKRDDVWARLKEEAASVLGSDRIGDYDAISKLQYHRMVLKETLRLYPSAPLRGRSLTEPVTLACGAQLPKECDVVLDFYSLHRDPTVFPDPEKFDPERFSEAQSEGRSPFAYLPFGGGPRRCVGEVYALNEGALALSALVHNYEWEIAPEPPVMLDFALTLRAKHGIQYVAFRGWS